jgi:hypothetical protein
MDVAALEDWLRRRLLRDANLCLLLSPLAVLGGLLVLFLTYWFSYAVIWLVSQVIVAIPELLFGTRWELKHNARLWSAAAFLVLLVVSYLRSDRRHAVSYGDFDDDPSNFGVAMARFGTGSGRAGLLLLHPGVSARMIVDLLFIGPRLLFGGSNLLRESGRARSANTNTGSRVLWTLLSQPRKVSYEELSSLYPAPELTQAFHALRLIPGVVFLELGVTLTDELRRELTAL